MGTDSRNRHFIVTSSLVLIIQIVLTGYGQIGPYIYICLLPAVILCSPTSWSTHAVMFEAFAMGLAVDCLADGPIGLNAAALVPVAVMQKPFFRLFLNSEAVDRGYNFSFRKNGFMRIASALSCEVILFFLIYVLIDSSGDRSAGFIVTRILLSSASSIPAGLVTYTVLSSNK